MAQPDAHTTPSAFPASDVVDLSHAPAFNPNRRWYDEYLEMMHRANDLAIDNGKLHQHMFKLRQALVAVLAETDGGSFLSLETRNRLQGLLNNERARDLTGR